MDSPPPAAAGEGRSPYDAFTDEQRRRYAARALTEDARRRTTAQFIERRRLAAAIEAGGGSRAEIEGSGLADADRRELRDMLDRRAAEEQATAAALARFNEPGAWDPANPADEADAERVLVPLGGDREALTRGEPPAHEALLRVARRTGIMPEVARAELDRFAATGTPDQKARVAALIEALPPERFPDARRFAFLDPRRRRSLDRSARDARGTAGGWP
jgi:hypothetical protein